MKKIFAISMAALMLAACEKEYSGTGSSLIAYTDGVVKSHLSMETGTGKVYWDANDAINVFSPNSGTYSSYKFTTSETGTSAKFNGGDVVIDENCFALFPYSETATFASGNVFTTKVSSNEQKMVDDSFTGSINLAVGRCTAEKKAAFKNVGGLICFTITQERADTIKFIEIKANNGEKIAVNGDVDIAWNEGEPTVTASSEATLSDVVTIKPAGDKFQTGETYYVWALPGTLSKGITVTLVSPTNMKATKVGLSPLTVSRSKIAFLGNIGGLEYKGSEAEKKSLTFDFSTCPEGWPSGVDAYKSKEPGEKEYSYTLDGVDYVFSTAVVTDVETTRSVCWGYNGSAACEMLIIQNERFLGLPAIEGWKLVQIKFAQTLATNSGRNMIITGIVSEKGKQEGVPGGEKMFVGTNGEVFTFNLSSPQANKRYYLAPVSKGTGLTSLTLVYEEAE